MTVKRLDNVGIGGRDLRVMFAVERIGAQATR